jgi:hypothetical protein
MAFWPERRPDIAVISGKAHGRANEPNHENTVAGTCDATRSRYLDGR